jgi:hypothetical protein
MVIWLGAVAAAKSWCASPIVAHEWGVMVLRPDGGQVLPAELPEWFERSGVSPAPGAARVRELPADSGMRTLPVVQFWRGDDRPGDVPLAVDVGFGLGTAAVWWPPVDELSLHTPARQLSWDPLTLGAVPAGQVHPSTTPWVTRLRNSEALWVGHTGPGGVTSERFLFYEGRTREESAVVVDGDVARNRGDWAVHDVRVVPRRPGGGGGDPAAGGVADVDLGARPRPGVGGAAGAVGGSRWSRAAAARVRGRRVRDGPRDPAVPLDRASGHQLYAEEVDGLLSVWGDRLFGAADHLLYREEPAALDQVMPVSLYTDMFHWLDWRRLSVVLVEGGPVDCAHARPPPPPLRRRRARRVLLRAVGVCPHRRQPAARADGRGPPARARAHAVRHADVVDRGGRVRRAVYVGGSRSRSGVGGRRWPPTGGSRPSGST